MHLRRNTPRLLLCPRHRSEGAPLPRWTTVRGQTESHDPRTNSDSASQKFGESHERENATTSLPERDELRQLPSERGLLLKRGIFKPHGIERRAAGPGFTPLIAIKSPERRQNGLVPDHGLAAGRASPGNPPALPAAADIGRAGRPAFANLSRHATAVRPFRHGDTPHRDRGVDLCRHRQHAAARLSQGPVRPPTGPPSPLRPRNAMTRPWRSTALSVQDHARPAHSLLPCSAATPQPRPPQPSLKR
jgi:hypothetical protein